MAKSFYEILGVSKDASDDEIKSSYRKLAREYHPDLNQGNEEAAAKFKEISEAYDTLSDPQKRQAYDNPNPFSDGGGFSGFGGGGGGSSFFDSIFDMFGGGGGGGARQAQTRGSDIAQKVSLTFEEAAFGTTREIKLNRSEPCASCKGTGAKDGNKFKACNTCGGTGRVRQAQNTVFGQIVNERPCPNCKGNGKVIIESCDNCGGHGMVRKSITLKVTIPAGVEAGQVLTVSGEGEHIKSGPPGNLRLVIDVQSHKVFKRNGRDLLLEVPVTFFQAALGEKIKVPTLKGTELHFSLPEGVQSGSVHRIRGQGISTSKGTGDMLLTVSVMTPKKLSRDQKNKMKALEEEFKVSQYDKIPDFQKHLS